MLKFNLGRGGDPTGPRDVNAPRPQELLSLTGSDLYEMIRGLPDTLTEVTEITTEAFVTLGPRAYRVDLADGTTVKARRFGSVQTARQVEVLLRALGTEHFPTVLGRRNTALLLEWIPGEAIERGAIRSDTLRKCGAIMGHIHSAPLPDDFREITSWTPAHYASALHTKLQRLRDANLLSISEADRLAALASSHIPEVSTIGIIHRDFCGENLVVDSQGRVWVIDNTSLAVGSTEFDLARTWYRWPLRKEERAVFLEAYASRHPFAKLENSFPFWVVAAIVASAAYRLQRGNPNLDMPAAGLRRLLDEGDRITPMSGGLA